MSIQSNLAGEIKSILQMLKASNNLPFTDVLSPKSICKKFDNVTFRNRVFSPDLTVYAFLSQVLGADQSCQATVAQVIAHQISQGKNSPSANTSAYCQARMRLPEEVLSSLAKESVADLEKQAHEGWLWRNRHIKMPDGTTVSMPDTPKNQEIYPQPASQKKGIGFPIARLVGIFSLGTGALLDLAIAPWSGKGTGEHALLRQLMHVFEAGDIVLGDAYYASFFLIATLQKMGADAVFPIHASRYCDFRKGERLGKKDHLMQWKKPVKPDWMDEQSYNDFPNFITVRETTVVSKRPGYRTHSKVLVTSFINNQEVTSQELGALYSYRWYVELNLRSIKEIMQMDILRSKTPEMIRKEIWAHALAYNLIRKIMMQAAVIHQISPRELSFKLSLQMFLAFRQAGILLESNVEIHAIFLKSIAYKRIGNRPWRSEPRMVKRRPKAFPRLQKPRNHYKLKAA